jgi:hypothetical protein
MVLVDDTQAPNLAPGSGGVACLQMTRGSTTNLERPLPLDRGLGDMDANPDERARKRLSEGNNGFRAPTSGGFSLRCRPGDETGLQA